MKNQKIKFSIAEPCHQDWNFMTPNEQGKFCDHCSKTVIDFTKLTDEEVLQLISANPGKICGRVNTSQMNRYMMAEKTASMGSSYQLLAGLFIATSTHSIAAPSNLPKMETVETKVNGVKLDSTEFPKDSLITVVEGIVRDMESNPMPGVVVKIRDARLGAVTDLDGKFKIVLPDTLSLNVIVLYAEYMDGTAPDLIIDRRQPSFTAEMYIKTVEETPMLGEMVIYKPKRWWQFWR